MKKSSSSNVLRSIIVTLLACLIVFGIALYIFGSGGFRIPKNPVINQITSSVSGAITVLTPDNTGADASGGMRCTMEYAPVCGTDNKTYSNACMANNQAAIVAHEGECEEYTSGNITTQSGDEDRICTMDYTPVCGVDNKTYSNTCMAGDTAIAHMGECMSTSTGTETGRSLGINTGALFDSGSYTLYANPNVGYSFAMPKYSYYTGYGARDGATHTMAIGTTGTGVADFSTATVQVWFYRKIPVTPPSDQSVILDNGILYIKNNDTTGNAKVGKIIETVLQSAK